ncbi:MAG: hypothetical protein R3F20_00675 [Planctomycetota bacterium]
MATEKKTYLTIAVAAALIIGAAYVGYEAGFEAGYEAAVAGGPPWALPSFDEVKDAEINLTLERDGKGSAEFSTLDASMILVTAKSAETTAHAKRALSAGEIKKLNGEGKIPVRVEIESGSGSVIEVTAIVALEKDGKLVGSSVRTATFERE